MSDTTTAAPAADPPAAPAEPAAKKDANRPYGVYAEETITLSDPESIAHIARHAIEGQDEVIVLVKVGRALAPDPKKAVGFVGQSRELEGDYEAIADSSRNKYPGLKTKTERTVAGL